MITAGLNLYKRLMCSSDRRRIFKFEFIISRVEEWGSKNLKLEHNNVLEQYERQLSFNVRCIAVLVGDVTVFPSPVMSTNRDVRSGSLQRQQHHIMCRFIS